VKTLSFKVTEYEARQIKARARKEKLTVSEYLRRQASATVAAAAKPARIRCRMTGATIFGALENHPPLTTERVRELLTDFP